MKTEIYRSTIIFTGMKKRQRKKQLVIETLDKRYPYTSEGKQAAIDDAMTWIKDNVKSHSGIKLSLAYVEVDEHFETWQVFGEKNEALQLVGV